MLGLSGCVQIFGMSAMGQKRTNHRGLLSAIVLKADIDRGERYVCFVPIRT
jgi:hypothetical protein